MNDPAPAPSAGALGIRRPGRNLLVYYLLESLLLGPFFPVLLIPRLFRFRTLRYHLEADGVSAEWGALFRREVSLGYSRIQDLHLASNVVERWLGLARIQVQTASGSSTAEMTIEGQADYEAVRDWIYERARGARRTHGTGSPSSAASPGEATAPASATEALHEAAAELRRIRELVEALAARSATGGLR